MPEGLRKNEKAVYSWNDHETPDANPNEVDYHIRTAANDPNSIPPGIKIKDVTRISGGVREAIVTDDEVLARLLGEAELALDLRENVSATIDPSINRDPLIPNEGQLQTIKEIYRGDTDENLNRVAIPVRGGRSVQPGLPEYGNTLKPREPQKIKPVPQPQAVIAAGIGGADVIHGQREAVGWEKPAPARTPQNKSFIKRLFGG